MAEKREIYATYAIYASANFYTAEKCPIIKILCFTSDRRDRNGTQERDNCPENDQIVPKSELLLRISKSIDKKKMLSTYFSILYFFLIKSPIEPKFSSIYFFV